MQNASNRKKNAVYILKAAVAAALISLVIGLNYFTGTENWTTEQYAYFYTYLAGNTFVLYLVGLGIIVWPLLCWREKGGAGKVAAFLVLWLGLVLLTADTFVFQQFRMHLNLAMLEMTLLGGGQIVKFSAAMQWQIAFMAVGLGGAAAFIVWLAGVGGGYVTRTAVTAAGVLGLGWIAVNVLYAVAFPVNNTVILTAAQRVPMASPLRMTRFLLKTGLITREALEEAKAQRVNASGSSALQYPLQPLQCRKENAPKNLVFLFVDSLRGDMLTPDIMPNLWALSQERDSSRFSRYFSGGNCTRTGIFSAFYGIPSSYWQAALASGTPSVLVQALQKQNYQIGTFTSTTLAMPEFDRTVFAGVKGLRVLPKAYLGLDRDAASIKDFKSWQQGLRKDRPFFSFLFLDMVHGVEFPQDEAHTVFKPSLETVNQLKLNADTDPVPYFNRYKNSAHFADERIGAVVDYLKAARLWDNTILLVSADHGDEFNDNGLNYWGHNGNFTAAQIQVPLVIHWPGRGKHDSDRRTSSADLTATLVPEVLGCTNPTTDYSTGTSLFAKDGRTWFHAGSYAQNAFVEENRIVLINSLGMLEYSDQRARPLKEKRLPSYMGQALEEMGRWYKR